MSRRFDKTHVFPLRRFRMFQDRGVKWSSYRLRDPRDKGILGIESGLQLRANFSNEHLHDIRPSNEFVLQMRNHRDRENRDET